LLLTVTGQELAGMRAVEAEVGMPVMGEAAGKPAMEAVAEKPVQGEAADMPERVVAAGDMPEQGAAAVEPAADEPLSSAGFDKPGQRSDYMTVLR
jgi:hypothetical protein